MPLSTKIKTKPQCFSQFFLSKNMQTNLSKFFQRHIHVIFQNIYDFCKKKAATMLTKTDDAVNYLFEEYRLLQEKANAIKF